MKREEEEEIITQPRSNSPDLKRQSRSHMLWILIGDRDDIRVGDSNEIKSSRSAEVNLQGQLIPHKLSFWSGHKEKEGRAGGGLAGVEIAAARKTNWSGNHQMRPRDKS